MKIEKIKDKSGKTIAVIYSFLDLLRQNKLREVTIIDEILNEIPHLDSCGYAGYLSKEGLSECLNKLIFSSETKTKCEPGNTKEIISEIKLSLESCSNVLKNERLNIFIFPNFDLFVKTRMFGNTGFTPWKNTVHLYVNSIQNNKIAYTLSHEIAHALSPYPLIENNQIGATLLYEGIAEKFREFFLGGEKAPWVKAISVEEANNILKKLNLEQTDYKLYKDLFFGSKDYPLWSGYTIGYKMAEKYLEKIIKKNWSKIVRTNMEKELTKMNFN